MLVNLFISVRARARFVEHENMPLAIAKEEYVKYIEYAREELEFDPNGKQLEIVLTTSDFRILA